jgi:membrane protein insertase Oxa1/YidC/SpoIIIJ
MPAGLTLYYFTSTTFSIGEQWYIRRLLVSRGVIPAAR